MFPTTKQLDACQRKHRHYIFSPRDIVRYRLLLSSLANPERKKTRISTVRIAFKRKKKGGRI